MTTTNTRTVRLTDEQIARLLDTLPVAHFADVLLALATPPPAPDPLACALLQRQAG